MLQSLKLNDRLPYHSERSGKTYFNVRPSCRSQLLRSNSDKQVLPPQMAKRTFTNLKFIFFILLRSFWVSGVHYENIHVYFYVKKKSITSISVIYALFHSNVLISLVLCSSFKKNHLILYSLPLSFSLSLFLLPVVLTLTLYVISCTTVTKLSEFKIVFFILSLQCCFSLHLCSIGSTWCDS